MAQATGRGPTQLGVSIRAVLRWDDVSGTPQALYLREGDTVQIGRETNNDIILSDPGVSRNHAILAWRDGAFEIADLGSTNGTQVNDQPVTDPRKLHDGDVIRVYQIELSFLEVSPTSAEAEQTPSRVKTGREPTFVVLPDSPQPRLIVSAGTEEGREIILPAGAIEIGRATARATWDVSLQDRAISRPHARIEQQDEGFVLIDLGSANGTQVNGRIIEEPTLLRDGDLIELGETTLLFRAR